MRNYYNVVIDTHGFPVVRDLETEQRTLSSLAKEGKVDGLNFTELDALVELRRRKFYVIAAKRSNGKFLVTLRPSIHHRTGINGFHVFELKDNRYLHYVRPEDK